MQPQHVLTPSALVRLLSIRDLADPARGPHAVQRALHGALDALSRAAPCRVVTDRSGPIVPRLDEERLGRDPSRGAARGGGLRHVSPVRVLRSGAASSMPALLRQVVLPPHGDLLLACAGAVHPSYGSRPTPTRDVRDAVVPHEAALWRLRRGPAFGLRDVGLAIGSVARALVPGLTVSAAAAALPYTVEARTLDVRVRGAWIELGRCGAVDPELLADLRLPPGVSALALSLDLDRVVMVAKGIDDARLLRARRRAVADQLLDLEPYVPPAARAAGGEPEEGPVRPALREGQAASAR